MRPRTTRPAGAACRALLITAALTCGVAALPAHSDEPSVQRLEAKPVEPGAAQRILEPQAAPERSLRDRQSLSQDGAGTLSTMTAGTAPVEIVELARALRNDPDLIYAYVHDNVDFEILFGAKKGAVGTLRDQRGNAFDQSALMVALLREAGYTADYVYGTIRLDPAQLENWLGVDPDPNAVGRLLGSAGIPAQVWAYSDGSLAYVDLDHVWVQTTIGGGSYVFDPSFKTHTEVAGIDLGTAMGYDRSTFLGSALSGATVATDYVQNLNRANLRGELATYAGNLVDHIEANRPAATLEEVIGGRKIDPVSGTLRQASLPYELSVTATWTDIPASYQTTLRIQHLGIDQTFDSAAIYGKRLTLFYNASDAPELRLDGALLATGTSATPGTSQDITLSVDHPYASNNGTYADQSRTFSITAGGAYFVTNGWGAMGRDALEVHRDRLTEARHAGGAEDAEPVLGETLTLIGYQWIAQKSQADLVAGQIDNTAILHHHWLGVTGQSQSPYIDMPMNAVSTISLSNDPAAESAAFFHSAGRGSAHEWGVVEQTQDLGAVSTVKLLDLSNAKGDKLFDATSANYGAIEPQLVNYSANEKAQVEAYLNSGFRVILPEDGDLGEQDWVGIGFLAISSNERQLGHIIGGGLKGGFGTTTGSADSGSTLNTSLSGAPDSGNNYAGNPVSFDPIDLVTGAFLYEADDLAVGNGSFPRVLGLKRKYTSAARLADGPFGLGWTHNLIISATPDSDGFQGLGEDSPLDAASAVATFHVVLDILQGSKTAERVSVAALAERWYMDQLIDNVVRVKRPEATQQFVRLADGAFNPPPGVASELTEEVDGSYHLRLKHGVEFDFGTDGRIASWSDPNGNSVTFTYSNGRLDQVDTGFGRTLGLSYNAEGRIASVSDGNGRSVSYGYDAAGNLTSVTDPLGEVTSFAYGQDGLITQIFYPTRPNDAFVTNTYDGLGRVSQQTDAVGNTYQYYFAGWRSEEVDPLGASSVLFFDEHGNTARTVDALGEETRFAYDGEQRVREEIFPEGNRTEYEYDSAHNVIQQTAYPKPGSSVSPITSSYTYEATFNRVATATDPLGRTTTYSYDATGNLVLVEAPTVGGQVPTTSYTYDGRGLVLSQTDPEGRITAYSYDATTGDRLSVTADDGGLNLTTTFAYDAVGNLTAETDPLGRTMSFAYDARRQLVQETAPAPFGYLTKYTYDAEGRRLTLEQETGDAANPWQVVSWTYTPTGKRASITDPAGDTTNFAYDARDRLWKTTDPTLAVTERQYDAAGQLTQVIDPLGHAIETYTYTANGVVASVTDGEANTTDYVYDGHDRRVQTVYPDGSTEQAAYDDAGNTVQRITRAGDTLSYAYDALNRRVQKTRPGPEVIDYSYDLTGLRTSVTGPEGTHDFTYDTAGRLVSVTDPQLRSVGYAYDAAGQRTELTYPDGDFVTYAYDALGRPTEARLNGTDLLASYSHDALSRRVGISYGNGASAAATFELDDDLSGLTHTLANETVDLTYSYNARGQRTSESLSSALYLWTPAATASTSYSVNVLNQYTDVGGVAFGYDANGNLTDDGVLSLGYDTENRLTSVTATGLSASYGYDSLDRRSTATVDGNTTEYLYSGSHVLVEYDGSGAEQRRFVYAPGVDEPLVMITAAGARYFYHQDALGSVIALSDGSGNVAERYAYGPFGETETVSSLGNPYRYTGRRFDEATALYHYRARAYSPELGRFLQPDPIGYGDGMNLYAYVGNDPVNNTDPTGLAAETAFDFAVLAYGIGSFWADPSWDKVIAVGIDAVGTAIPFVPAGGGRVYLAKREMTKIANRADRIPGPPGTTMRGGQNRHQAAEEMVNSHRSGKFSAEQTYLDRRPRGGDRGLRGSSRADSVFGDVNRPDATFDFKFGRSGMSNRQYSQLRRNLPRGSGPTIEIRPGPVLPRSGYGAAYILGDDLGSLFDTGGVATMK